MRKERKVGMGEILNARVVGSIKKKKGEKQSSIVTDASILEHQTEVNSGPGQIRRRTKEKTKKKKKTLGTQPITKQRKP